VFGTPLFVKIVIAKQVLGQIMFCNKIGFGMALFVNTTQPFLQNMFGNNIKIFSYDY